LSVPKVAIAYPLKGNPVFVDVMDLLFRGSLRFVLTSAIELVNYGVPSLRILGRARDYRLPGKVTGVSFSQFSNMELQLLGFGVLRLPAVDIYIACELSEVLDFCIDV
jgi:hypothetical protein